jgi:hypothetical protein
MNNGENQPPRVKESRKRNLMRISEQTLELLSVFKDANRNLKKIFTNNKEG